MKEKSRERRARRAAARLGLILRKARTDETWMIVDTERGAVVASGWTLKAVEKWLAKENR